MESEKLKSGIGGGSHYRASGLVPWHKADKIRIKISTSKCLLSGGKRTSLARVGNARVSGSESRPPHAICPRWVPVSSYD